VDQEPSVPRDGRTAGVRADRKADHGKTDDVQSGGSAANAGSTDFMTYRGGPIQTAPRVYLLFWGTSFWTYNDHYGVRTSLTNLYNGIGGTVWGSEMKEYNVSSYSFTNPANVLKGVAYDSTPPARTRPTE